MQSKPGRELRKLRLLLQHWWENNLKNDLENDRKHLNKSTDRSAYLQAGLLIGAALYLNQDADNGLDKSRLVDKKRLAETIKSLSTLWRQALPAVRRIWSDSINLDRNLNLDQDLDLSADGLLLQTFIDLANHKLLLPVFSTPLCPALIYEAFGLEERRFSNEQLQDPATKQNSAGRQLISFTQVNTPDYIAAYLLNNTLVPALRANLEASKSILAVHGTTLLDPCLGTGVFLVQAIDAFIDAYKTFGLTVEEALDQSLRHNLYGLEIDAPALATAALCLILKAFSLGLGEGQIKNLLPFANLHLLADKNFEQLSGAEFPLGSLRPDLREQAGHPLNRRYDVVVANPPYLGRKLMPHALKEQLRQYYPVAANDLSQAFFSLALDLVKDKGYVGLIAPSSLLHLHTAKPIRRRLLADFRLLNVVELGASVFPLLAGEKSATTLLILQNSQPLKNTPGQCDSQYENLGRIKDKPLHLQMHPQKDGAPNNSGSIRRNQIDFLNDADLVINFRRPQVITGLRSQMTKLADLAEIKQGLATTNNGRFLRFIWELPAAHEQMEYVPYCRGEGAERWWSAPTTMVLWENQGQAIKAAVTESYPYLKGNYAWVVKNEDYYFRPGLTFSFVSKAVLAVRQLQAGCIFDVGSSAIFVKDAGPDLWLLAYLNSSFATALAHDLNPSINMQVGDLKKIFVPDFAPDIQQTLAESAAACIEAKKALFRLTNPQHFFAAKSKDNRLQVSEADFVQSQTTIEASQATLQLNESRIDRIVAETLARHYQLDMAQQAELHCFAGSNERQKNTTIKGISRFKVAAPANKYCANKLVEIFLRLLFTGGDKSLPAALLIGTDSAAATLVSLADLVARQLTDSFIDWQFLQKSLASTDLIAYIKDELPRALDYYFLGQPPLIFCHLTNNDLRNTTMILSAALIQQDVQLQPEMIITCGGVAPEVLNKVPALIAKLREDPNLTTTRPATVRTRLTALANNTV